MRTGQARSRLEPESPPLWWRRWNAPSDRRRKGVADYRIEQVGSIACDPMEARVRAFRVAEVRSIGYAEAPRFDQLPMVIQLRTTRSGMTAKKPEHRDVDGSRHGSRSARY